jgi:hypothetical protein
VNDRPEVPYIDNLFLTANDVMLNKLVGEWDLNQPVDCIRIEGKMCKDLLGTGGTQGNGGVQVSS